MARSKYSNASAISSLDFQAVAPPEEAKPQQPVDNQMSREQWLEMYASSSAISSADLMKEGDANQAGLARKMAESGITGARKVGGIAASIFQSVRSGKDDV